MARCLLFTPADRPERFTKGAASGADGVVLDLEDGVGPAAKADARQAVREAFATPSLVDDGRAWLLRINPIATATGLQDLLLLRDMPSRPLAVMLPKVESDAEVAIACAHWGDAGAAAVFVPLIESARGLAASERIAAHPSVVALAFGGADLAFDLGAALAWEPLLFARSRLVLAAACAGIVSWDMPFLDIGDIEGLTAETRAARSLGFAGKLAIHPAQVAPIHAALTPSAEACAEAARIITASDAAGGGACQIDGRMIDGPIVKAARRTLALAARSG